MKNKHIITKYLLCLLIVPFFLAGCKKNDDDLGTAPRLFRPIFSNVETADGQNWIRAEWPRIIGTKSFTLELSLDTFKTIYKSVSTDTTFYVFENLDWEKNYQLRIKGMGTNIESDYLTVVNVKISDYPTLLSSVAPSDIIDVAIIARWTNDATPFTSLKLVNPLTHDTVKASLSADDLTSGFKEVRGLTPGTDYILSIYSDNTYRGKKLFKTAAAQVFAIPVDLRDLDDVTAKTYLTTAYLQGLADGSTIILKRGMTYMISGTVAFQNSVTFTTGLGFGNNLAVLDLTTGNFNTVASANVGQVTFKDVNLIGNQAAYGARYVLNINVASTLGKVIMDGCKVRDLRGVIRVQAATIIDTVKINNCLIDSIKDYGVVNSGNASALIKNIKVTNSTISNAQKLFINSSSSGTESIVLQNNTFCYTPLGGSYIMDYNGRTIINGVTITNCIFGPGINNAALPTALDSINGFRGTANFTTNGNYQTSDLKFMQKGGVLTYPLSGLDASYSGKSTTLFKQPDQADFTIIDLTFVGKSSAGDPRWRK